MFRLMLGIVLMGVSVIVMIFMLQDPAGQPALADLFKDLHCGPGETVRQMVSTGGGSLLIDDGQRARGILRLRERRRDGARHHR
ncbi:MAG: hypothetical protein DWB42_14570 [Chloroflexi bacterium]|nr:hypothetical protein [Chloroflexota bacterium]MDL1884947.1 hypothetical protein [Anaerolineae bacterium CFX8]